MFPEENIYHVGNISREMKIFLWSKKYFPPENMLLFFQNKQQNAHILRHVSSAFIDCIIIAPLWKSGAIPDLVCP